MKTILISPFSRKSPDGKPSPKDYPHWPQLVKLLQEKGYTVIQVGITGEPPIGANEKFENLSFEQLLNLLNTCETWISIDNFFHHFAHYYKKYGFVIWATSDPKIFGYPENTNILLSEKNLRPNQFDFWWNEKYNPELFPSADFVVNTITAKLG